VLTDLEFVVGDLPIVAAVALALDDKEQHQDERQQQTEDD
jgi:hypothetical protein